MCVTGIPIIVKNKGSMERFSVVIREFHAEEGKLIYETYYFWS
jgi:hypothetical protein